MDCTKLVIDEFTITYRLLATMGHTATGPDGLPSWFIGTVATARAESVEHPFASSILAAYVSPQWKVSAISPVPKVT